MKSSVWMLVVALSGAVVLGQGRDASRQVEWLYYGGDQGGMKFSPLTDITADNVQQLQLAWQFGVSLNSRMRLTTIFRRRALSARVRSSSAFATRRSLPIIPTSSGESAS